MADRVQSFVRITICLLVIASIVPFARAQEDPPAPPGKPAAEALHVAQVSPSCYAVVRPNAQSNAGFVIGKSAVLVVDCLGLPERAKALLAEIRKRTGLPVKWLVHTHWHYDHTIGNQAFPEQTTILASDAAAKRLNARLKADRMLLGPGTGMHRKVGIRDVRTPTERIGGERVIDLGGLKVRLLVAGDCITPGDLVAYVPSEKVLFAGDLAWNRAHPSINEGSTFRWIMALAALSKFEIEKVVPGHGEVGGKGLLNDQRHYLMELRRVVKHLARAKIDGAEIVARITLPEKYAEYEFKAWWPGNVRYVVSEILQGR